MSRPDAYITQVSQTDAVQPISASAPQGEATRPQRCSRAWKYVSSLIACLPRIDKTPAAASSHGADVDVNVQSADEDPEPVEVSLLPPLASHDSGKKCLVLDLDETLVHSSFQPVPGADFIIPLEIEGTTHHVYVLKRPHVDAFLTRMGEIFEIVIFTASLSKYADAVIDLLDHTRVVRHRLFREHCSFHQGAYVKDLGRLGRGNGDVMIVDNSPLSYTFNPQHAVPITSWFSDTADTELLTLIPFLEQVSSSSDIFPVLATRH